MLPYGIIIKQNRAAMQQSVSLWQKKFGILNFGRFLKISFPSILIFSAISIALQLLTQKEENPLTTVIMLIIICSFTVAYMYISAMRTVKQYSENVKEKRVQLVLKEETLEITTEFSKEIIPYSEIDYCYEKDFLVTLMYDKKNFPISLSKVNFEKGNYDVFVSILKSKIPDRYEKRGEN